ncbi:hypothetical protein GYMC10_2259 [Paenibacillus sp. Y412MC10]|nr:hypothetical protein GYMC10_2259 [Paenibacillus sp. Y412MC10]
MFVLVFRLIQNFFEKVQGQLIKLTSMYLGRRGELLMQKR